ncbi:MULTISPECIES: beta/gamma crystallin-related protein [unclassified Nostoc]|uniref:beta/gamma crystallin-related protein n=1 Tax=unclassified Nostoc TaxID=2593658 RepID=UPI0025AA406C|nr:MULTISPECIES: beta/gamma crystallin-related protein [unclassified Nostoc]MDM9586277.1 beta/gamma crystallin-related protein [Nostoc sp. GT001]MDZ7943765.1 beta/gamma crystallin-related protein [Nostoc sp. EfeVER01]MDZ7990804.1 beta/gamma crystallin-related protein [Nostoc sp. EspVER01]
MSNINNYGAGMNNIELSPLFQDMTSEQGAAIQGGAAIEFFEDVNFGKTTSGLVTTDLSYVGDFWNDKISSVKVYSGRWEFWTDANYSGRVLTLDPGEYASFAPNTNDVFSSVRSV